MHIFIDETGSFTGIGKAGSISMIGALIVPDARLRSLEREYQKIRKSLPVKNDEVKGKLLSEKDVLKVMPALRHHDALFEVIGIDLGMHSESGIRENQRGRAAAMTNGLSDEHHQTMIDAIWEARRQLEGYSLQLNIQSALIFELVRTVLEHSTLYFSQRRPKELANFHWVIDAKGGAGVPTSWESWWSMFIKPALQTKLALDPMRSIKVGDYSHMARFHMKNLSDFHKEILSIKSADAPPIDLGKILSEHLKFSHVSEPGLELVDILVNATRRALRGHLGPEGWQEIPSIMISRNPQNIPMVSLDQAIPLHARLPYGATIKAFDHNCRSMLTAKNKQASW